MQVIQEHISLPVGEILHFIPIGDIHYNDLIRCDRTRLHRLIQWCTEQVEKGVHMKLLGMGDYLDTFSHSERRILMSGLHESSEEWLERKGREDLAELAQVFEPMRNNWIGFIEGNHTTIVPESATWLSQIFTAPCFGVSCMYRLIINEEHYFNILAHHGRNTGNTWGSKVNARARAHSIWPDAHIVCMGHDHAKFSCPTSGLGMDADGNMREHKTYLVGTGSFLQGYVTEGSYVETALYNPADLGVAIATLKVSEHNNRRKLSYHVSV
jgi:hypothetical protein